jgi:lysozyme family protein
MIMQNFDDAFAALMANEGTYSNNPADPGGETMYGITKRVAVANGYAGDMKALPLALAQAIARKLYWSPCGCDQYDPNLAFQVFDAAYNSGVTQASQWLQRAAGVTPDGLIGAKTVAAIRAQDWRGVAFRFIGLRLAFYAALPTWTTFGKGWTNRIANNLARAGAT